MFRRAVFTVQFVTIALLHLAKGYPQTQVEDQSEIRAVRPGRYVPELHGGDRGKYMPDLSGKYQHMVKPYDGGYGDRGVKYQQDLRGILQGLPGAPRAPGQSSAAPFELGPRDHLRFMIDFNYDGSGWQVLQFEWKRDGEESRSYNYQNENKLEWAVQEENSPTDEAAGYVLETPAAEEQIYDLEPRIDGRPESSNVHVDGEYDANIYNVSYENKNAAPGSAEQKDLQQTIKEVLDYVQTHILPTLT